MSGLTSTFQPVLEEVIVPLKLIKNAPLLSAVEPSTFTIIFCEKTGTLSNILNTILAFVAMPTEPFVGDKFVKYGGVVSIVVNCHVVLLVFPCASSP